MRDVLISLIELILFAIIAGGVCYIVHWVHDKFMEHFKCRDALYHTKMSGFLDEIDLVFRDGILELDKGNEWIFAMSRIETRKLFEVMKRYYGGEK